MNGSPEPLRDIVRKGLIKHIFSLSHSNHRRMVSPPQYVCNWATKRHPYHTILANPFFNIPSPHFRMHCEHTKGLLEPHSRPDRGKRPTNRRQRRRCVVYDPFLYHVVFHLLPFYSRTLCVQLRSLLCARNS